LSRTKHKHADTLSDNAVRKNDGPKRWMKNARLLSVSFRSCTFAPPRCTPWPNNVCAWHDHIYAPRFNTAAIRGQSQIILSTTSAVRTGFSVRRMPVLHRTCTGRYRRGNRQRATYKRKLTSCSAPHLCPPVLQ